MSNIQEYGKRLKLADSSLERSIPSQSILYSPLQTFLHSHAESRHVHRRMPNLFESLSPIWIYRQNEMFPENGVYLLVQVFYC